MKTDYEKYRGKCKKMSKELVAENPELILVRGHYICPFYGKEAHWWVKDKNGKIIDPTKNQFPSKGRGEYIEFDGIVTCEECGKEIPEEEALFMGRYPCCSDRCAARLIGL